MTSGPVGETFSSFCPRVSNKWTAFIMCPAQSTNSLESWQRDTNDGKLKRIHKEAACDTI